MAAKGLEKYLEVKTAQDLIDLRVKPKDSSTHLALITYERLVALKRKIQSSLNDDMTGSWIPVVNSSPSGGYVMNPGVVANEQLGHKVRLKNGFKGQARSSEGERINIEIPANAPGMIRSYTSGKITVVLDQALGRRNIINFDLESVVDNLEASSLGQILPQERQQMVMDQALDEFFPRTRLDNPRAYRTLIALLIGKDMGFDGPPGSGKSSLARDIVEIAQRQEYIFVVDGCKSQCSPFSLFDSEFMKINGACDECMERNSPGYKENGIFTPPKPKDVKVKVQRYSEGRGIEKIQGTVSVDIMHLAGYKLPDFNSSGDSDFDDESSTKGFHLGKLPRTNNGILVIEEMDKIRPQSLDILLEALNSGRIMPDQLRVSYPCYSNIISTLNDSTVLSEPIRDRMFILSVRYPEEVDTNHQIIRSAYHGEHSSLEDVEIGDTHTKEGRLLRSIPMPVMVEKAVVSLFMKYINEYQGQGKNNIQGSNRCRIDALDAARAKLVLESIFFDGRPRIVTPEFATYGMQFALCSRVAENSRERSREVKNGIIEWVAQNFPGVLSAENNTWWCNFYKHLAVAKTQVPEIEGNCEQEKKGYGENPGNSLSTFKAILNARTNPSDRTVQRARIDYPLMDYLFSEQPRMDRVTGEVLPEFVDYFIKSSIGAACKV